MTSNFPVLYGRRITNTLEFKDALVTAMADTARGKISPRESREVNRKARVILKMFEEVVRGRRDGTF